MFGQNAITKQNPADTGMRLPVQEIFPTVQGEGPYAGRPCVFLRLRGCNLACTFCDTDFESGKLDLEVNELIETLYMAMDHVKTDLLVISGGEPMIHNLGPLLSRLHSDSQSHGLVAFQQVQIETAGTVWQNFDTYTVVGFLELVQDQYVTLVCSPKTPKVHKKIERYCQHWKYVARAGSLSTVDGLPNVGTQAPVPTDAIFGAHSDNKIARPPKGARVYLQPCEEYKQTRVVKWVGMKGGFVSPDTTQVSDPKATQRNTQAAVAACMEFGYNISLQQHKYLGLR